MIRVSQTFSGNLQEALPLSFFVATSVGDLDMLTIGVPDSPWAVVLSGENPFVGYECGLHDLSGLVIPNVTIELDPTKVFDASFGRALPGSIILIGNEPSIRLSGNHGMMHTRPIYGSAQLEQGGVAVGFPRWQIVIGEGENKKILKVIDVQSP